MKNIKFISFILLLIFLYSFKGDINFPGTKIGNTVNDFNLKNIDFMLYNNFDINGLSQESDLLPFKG